MGRSLGYYGIKMDGHEYSNQLIRDMVEEWGDDLGQLDEKSTLMFPADCEPACECMVQEVNGPL